MENLHSRYKRRSSHDERWWREKIQVCWLIVVGPNLGKIWGWWGSSLFESKRSWYDLFSSYFFCLNIRLATKEEWVLKLSTLTIFKFVWVWMLVIISLVPWPVRAVPVSGGGLEAFPPCLLPTPPPPSPPRKELHNLCFLFLLGRLLYPREIGNNYYAKFGGKHGALWSIWK